MAGIIQLFAGAFRMGLWFRAVSPSVIHGMLAGIGVSIVANQLYVMMDSKPEGHALANLMLFPAKLEHLGESLMAVPVTEWLTTFTGSAEHIALAIGLIAVLTTAAIGSAHDGVPKKPGEVTRLPEMERQIP